MKSTHRLPSSFACLLALGLLSGCGTMGDNDVTGTAIDTYATLGGTIDVPVEASKWASVQVISELSGIRRSYPVMIEGDGSVRVAGVPDGPYWLAITDLHYPSLPGVPGVKRFYETTSRTLDIGTLYSFRQDVEPITKPTPVDLSASLSTPWQAFEEDSEGNILQDLDDSLRFVSCGADTIGEIRRPQSAESGAPVNGATALSGWTFDPKETFHNHTGDAPNLVRTDKKDDAAILHHVASKFVAPSPPATPDLLSTYTYSAVKAALRPAALEMSDGVPVAMSGDFEDAPQKTFAFDYKGSAWSALLADAPSADLYRVTLTFEVYMEPGAPAPAYGAYAPLLDLTVGANRTWVDPLCNPDACDAAACPGGCSDESVLRLPGDHTNSFSYGNPFDFGQELASVTLTFYSDVTALMPEGQMTAERLIGRLTLGGSAADLAGASLEPVIGLPRNVKVNGKPAPVDKVTTGVGATPEITFEPPSLGTPSYYIVSIQDLDDVTDDTTGGSLIRRTIATFRLTGTRLTIPAELLQEGKHYFVQVNAVVDDESPAAPFQVTANGASAVTYTGIIMP